LVGGELAGQLEEFSYRIFRLAQVHCRESGFVLVDTKFEFGFIEGVLTLIDELLTPDSSRLWELSVEVGSDSYGFDKQLVRDYLTRSGWDRNPPSPALPDELVLEACRRITGNVL
jgi:phosphoribosylaminoimidazole-succinocarboxamide synthase